MLSANQAREAAGYTLCGAVHFYQPTLGYIHAQQVPPKKYFCGAAAAQTVERHHGAVRERKELGEVILCWLI